MTHGADIVAERYRPALEGAVEYIRQTFRPMGIVVSGTIVRGRPDPASDLDIVVVHEAPWRQRLQRFFDGVPAEIFVNPSDRIRLTFEMEAAEARPVLAHMFASGAVILDQEGSTTALQAEARESLRRGPTLTDRDITAWRYRIATTFEDATDILDRDPERAWAMVSDSIVGAARLAFVQAGRWLPREKDLLAELEMLHPRLAQEVRAVLHMAADPQQIERAGNVIDEIVGSTRFFEWESEREPVD